MIKQITQTFLLLSLLLLGTTSWSAVESHAPVLSFQTWKSSQVMKAQNQVVRMGNRILLLQQDKNLSDPAGEGQQSLDTANSSSEAIDGLKKNMGQAQQDLQMAQELDFDDYLSVYLTEIGEDETRLQSLAEQLSKEEVKKTLIYLQRYKKGVHAKRLIGAGE